MQGDRSREQQRGLLLALVVEVLLPCCRGLTVHHAKRDGQGDRQQDRQRAAHLRLRLVQLFAQVARRVHQDVADHLQG